MFAVQWQASKADANHSTASDFTVLADSAVTRTVNCPAHQDQCSPVVIFLTNVVE
jgi:hypothetical protein